MGDKWMWICLAVVVIISNLGGILSDRTRAYKEVELAKIECQRGYIDDGRSN